MFRSLRTRLLALGVFYTVSGISQPVIPDRNLLPQVQFHNPYPLGTSDLMEQGGARLVARSQSVYNGGRFISSDSVHFRYPGKNEAGQDGSPVYSERLNQDLRTGMHAGSDRRSLQTFTADHKLAVSVMQRWDTASASWGNQCRQSFTYRQGLLVRDTAWNWDGKKDRWVPAAYTYYFRNEAGLPGRILTFHWNAARGGADSAAELRYSYNEAGKVTGCVARYGAGRLRLTGRQVVSYTEGGAASGMYHQRWDSVSGSWKADYGFRFTHGSRDERLSQANLQWSEARAAWDTLAGYSYNYDAGGRLVSMDYFTGNGQGRGSGLVDRYEYAYDMDGRRIGALRKSTGPRSPEPVVEPGSEKILFYYEPLSAEAVSGAQPDKVLHIWPVPAGRQLNVDVRMLQGQPYQAILKDLQGRNLGSWSRAAGGRDTDQLGLDGYPAGTYNLFLRAGSGKTYIARFLIAR